MDSFERKQKSKLFKQNLAIVSLAIVGFGVCAFTAYAQLTKELLKQSYYERETQIETLNNQIITKQREIDSLKDQQQEYAQLVEEKQAAALDLVNQIAELDTRITKTELDIERFNQEIELLEIEIEQTNVEIDTQENLISNKKEKIAEFIRTIHQNDSRNYLQLLLLNESFAEFFNYVQNLEEVQDDLVKTLYEVQDLKTEYEVAKITLENKKFDLQELRITTEQKQIQLEHEKQAREVILAETENSEEKFQQLLNVVREDRDAADREISLLEDEVKVKLAQHSFNFSLDPTQVQLVWPVPNQGITTYFHDPTYAFKRWVGEHSGLDLRTLIDGRPTNGLQVRAASSGVIVKIIRNGRYVGNAVYIAHSDNIMTVYLHLSKINVTEDEFVPIGGVIGLSGGMPGTPGAGLSSGPHLHFEVRVDGIPVDPLEYLPYN